MIRRLRQYVLGEKSVEQKRQKYTPHQTLHAAFLGGDV